MQEEQLDFGDEVEDDTGGGHDPMEHEHQQQQQEDVDGLHHQHYNDQAEDEDELAALGEHEVQTSHFAGLWSPTWHTGVGWYKLC